VRTAFFVDKKPFSHVRTTIFVDKKPFSHVRTTIFVDKKGMESLLTRELLRKRKVGKSGRGAGGNKCATGLAVSDKKLIFVV
jgi:hypothetical protein